MSRPSSRPSFTKRLLPAVIASTIAFGGSASAVQFQGVYVFGDSLSDAGYFRPFLASILGQNTANSLGRFTTNPGPVWAELIAQNYGGNPNPSNAGGQIYAQGGARVSTASTSTPPGGAQRPVSTQVTEYLAANSGTANPNGLYAVWAGANDIFQTLPALGAGTVNPATFLAATTLSQVQQIGRLQAAGARYVLVFALPDIGTTPQFNGTPFQATVTGLSAGYNVNLFNTIAAGGLRVIPVDTFTLLSEVRANAAAFGFTNTTGVACGPFPVVAPAGGNSQFCGAGNLVAANAQNTYMFADGVHPTTGAHRIVADLVKSLIDAPNAYSTMAEVPLASRAGHIRTLDAGLQQAANSAVGKVAAFAAYDGGKFDLSTSTLNPQTNTKNRTATVGVTMRVSEAVTAGIAIGKSNNETTMGAIGRYDLDETAFSLFASAKFDGFYGNATFSNADLKYNGIRRNVQLGSVLRVNNASTNGSNVSASLMAGYDFKFGSVAVGPFVGLTRQTVSVSGFQENAGAAAVLSTDLRLDEQTRQSRVTSVGLRASVTIGSVTPFLRVSADRDDNNKERFVTASPVSITQNIKYNIPGYRGDGKWVTGTIGVRGNITEQIGFGIAYTGVSSKEGVKQDGVTANVSFAF